MIHWNKESMDPGIKAALRDLEKAINGITDRAQKRAVGEALRELSHAWEAAFEELGDSIRPLPKGKPW